MVLLDEQLIKLYRKLPLLYMDAVAVQHRAERVVVEDIPVEKETEYDVLAMDETAEKEIYTLPVETKEEEEGIVAEREETAELELTETPEYEIEQMAKEYELMVDGVLWTRDTVKKEGKKKVVYRTRALAKLVVAMFMVKRGGSIEVPELKGKTEVILPRQEWEVIVTDLDLKYDEKTIIKLIIPEMKVRPSKKEGIYEVTCERFVRGMLYWIGEDEIQILKNINPAAVMEGDLKEGYSYSTYQLLKCNEYGSYHITHHGVNYIIRNLALKRIIREKGEVEGTETTRLETKLTSAPAMYFNILKVVLNQVKLFREWVAKYNIEDRIVEYKGFRYVKSLPSYPGHRTLSLVFEALEYNRDFATDDIYKVALANRLVRVLYNSEVSIENNLNVSRTSFRWPYNYKDVTFQERYLDKFAKETVNGKSVGNWLDIFLIGERADLGNLRLLSKDTHLETDIKKKEITVYPYNGAGPAMFATDVVIETEMKTGLDYISEITEQIPFWRLMSPKRINVTLKNIINSHRSIEHYKRKELGQGVKLKARFFNPFSYEDFVYSTYLWDGGVILSESGAEKIRYIMRNPISVSPQNIKDEYIEALLRPILVEAGEVITEEETMNAPYIVKTRGIIEVSPVPVDFYDPKIRERQLKYPREMVKLKKEVFHPKFYDIVLNIRKMKIPDRDRFKFMPLTDYIKEVMRRAGEEDIIKGATVLTLRTFQRLQLYCSKMPSITELDKLYKKLGAILDDELVKRTIALVPDIRRQIENRIKLYDFKIIERPRKLEQRTPGDTAYIVVEGLEVLKEMERIRKRPRAEQNVIPAELKRAVDRVAVKRFILPWMDETLHVVHEKKKYLPNIGGFEYKRVIVLPLADALTHVKTSLGREGRVYFTPIEPLPEDAEELREDFPIGRDEVIKYNWRTGEWETVVVSTLRKLRVGDKIITKSGGKWIVSKILPDDHPLLRGADIIVPINKFNSTALFAEIVTSSDNEKIRDAFLTFYETQDEDKLIDQLTTIIAAERGMKRDEMIDAAAREIVEQYKMEVTPESALKKWITKWIIENLRGELEIMLLEKFRFMVYKHWDYEELVYSGIKLSESFLSILIQYRDPIVNDLIHKKGMSHIQRWLNYVWKTFRDDGSTEPPENLDNIRSIDPRKALTQSIGVFKYDEERKLWRVTEYSIPNPYDAEQKVNYFVPMNPEDQLVLRADMKMMYNPIFDVHRIVSLLLKRDKYGRLRPSKVPIDKRKLDFLKKERLDKFFNGKKKFIDERIISIIHKPSRYLLAIPADLTLLAYEAGISPEQLRVLKVVPEALIPEAYRAESRISNTFNWSECKKDTYSVVLVNPKTFAPLMKDFALRRYDSLLIAREPIVHKGSLAVVIPFFTEEIPVGCIGLHPTMCLQFNADFDGDMFIVLPVRRDRLPNTRRYTVDVYHGKELTEEDRQGVIRKLGVKDIAYMSEYERNIYIREKYYPLLSNVYEENGTINLRNDYLVNERMKEGTTVFDYLNIFRVPINLHRAAMDYALLENVKVVYAVQNTGFIRKRLTYHLQAHNNPDLLAISNIANVEAGMGKAEVALADIKAPKEYYQTISAVYRALKTEDYDKRRELIYEIRERLKQFETLKVHLHEDALTRIEDGTLVHKGHTLTEEILIRKTISLLIENWNALNDDEIWTRVMKRRIVL